MKFLVILAMGAALAACSSPNKQTSTSDPQLPPSTSAVKVVQTPTSVIVTDLVKKEVCQASGDTRLLELHKKSTGCELDYTKFGKAKVISSSKHGTKHCEASFEKITKELEAQKFKCDAS